MRKLILAAVVALVALWAVALIASGANGAASWSAGDTTVHTQTLSVGRKDRLAVGTRLHVRVAQRVRSVQWLRCNTRGRDCKRIRGATHATYVVRSGDLGHSLRARVVTWQGNTIVLTAPTPQVGRPLPVNTALPTIADGGQGGGSVSGPIVGDVLTGTNGTWQHAVRFTYQWEDCDANGQNCVPISGATSSTYTLQDSDVGDTLVFQVTAYNF